MSKKRKDFNADKFMMKELKIIYKNPDKSIPTLGQTLKEIEKKRKNGQ